MGFGFGAALGGILGGLFGSDESTKRLGPGDVAGPVPPVKSPTVTEAPVGFLGLPTAAEFYSPARDLAVQTIARYGDVGSALNVLIYDPASLTDSPEMARQAVGLISSGMHRSQNGTADAVIRALSGPVTLEEQQNAQRDRGSQLYGETLARLRQPSAAGTAINRMSDEQINSLMPGSPITPIGVGANPFSDLRSRIAQVPRPPVTQLEKPQGVDIKAGLPNPFARATAPKPPALPYRQTDVKPVTSQDVVNHRDYNGRPANIKDVLRFENARRPLSPDQGLAGRLDAMGPAAGSAGGSPFVRVGPQRAQEIAARIRSGRFDKADVTAVINGGGM